MANCAVKDCEQTETHGWIDFVDYKGDLLRLRFCKPHFEAWWAGIQNRINEERKSGDLRPNEDYVAVPPHIYKEVFKETGTDIPL